MNGFSTVKGTRVSWRPSKPDVLAARLWPADAGVRPVEGCAVKWWSDFDSVARTLHIERAVTRTGRIKGVRTGDDREVDLSHDCSPR
jgi:hypothetical protein